MRGVVLCGSRSELLSVYRTKLGVGLGALLQEQHINNYYRYEYILRASWRDTKTQPEKGLDTEKSPGIGKNSFEALQIVHF